MYKIFACLCCVFVGIADTSAAQQAAFKADGSFPLNFWPNRAFLNNDIKAALDTVKLNVARGGRVAVFVGCAEESEKDARFLAEVRPVYAKSWLTDEGGNSDTAGGSILLRSCNHLGSGPSLVYLFQEGHVPSNEEMDSHDVSVTLPTHAAKAADYTVTFHDESLRPKSQAILQQVALDAQAHANQGYVLTTSCGVHDVDCSEMEWSKNRREVVRRTLIQAGVDARRITEQRDYEDGTAAVHIFVIRDANQDVRVAGPQALAETPPGNFLIDVLPSVKTSLSAADYERTKSAFLGCKAVTVVLYPPTLSLGWSEQKGSVRLLSGELSDPHFQGRLQALDVRRYLPSACMYEDVPAGHFQQPPAGILVKRLDQASAIQTLNPVNFTVDSQLGDALAPGQNFTDHNWTIAPAEGETHAFQITLKDGTTISAPIEVEEKWTFYTKKLWVVIVALAGVGFFGAVTGLFKKKPPEKV